MAAAHRALSQHAACQGRGCYDWGQFCLEHCGRPVCARLAVEHRLLPLSHLWHLLPGHGLYVYIVVPETKQMSLEDVETMFDKGDVPTYRRRGASGTTAKSPLLGIN